VIPNDPRYRTLAICHFLRSRNGGQYVLAVVLPRLSGRIAGALGALAAALTLACLSSLPRFRARLAEDPPAFARRGQAVFWLAAPFLLRALVIGRAPTCAFWRLDGRSALLLAWLASTALAIYFERRSA
jgi:hypothetical protein